MAEKHPTPPKKTLKQLFKKKGGSPKQPAVSSSADDTQLSEPAQASQLKDEKKVRTSFNVFKKKGSSPKQPSVSSSADDTQLSEPAQASLQVKDEEVVRRQPVIYVKKKDGSPVPRPVSSSADDSQLSEPAQASLQVKDEEVVRRQPVIYVKKKDGSPVPRPVSSSADDTQLSEPAQASLQVTDEEVVGRLPVTYVKEKDGSPVPRPVSSSADYEQMWDTAQASQQVKDEVVCKSPVTYVKEKDGSPVPRPVSSSADYEQMWDTAQASLQVKEEEDGQSPVTYVEKKDGSPVPPVSSSADDKLSDTAQATAEVHDEEFVPTQHPTGGARYVASSPMDLQPVKPGDDLTLPPVSTSPLRQMFASPSTKTPEQSAEDSANRKPSRVCSECKPNVTSPGSVCPHIAQASRQLQFRSQTDRSTESTQLPRPRPQRAGRSDRTAVFGLKLGDDVAATGSDIPRVIVRCVAIIEAWCTKNRKNCIYIYQPPENQEQIKAIEKAFAEGDDRNFGSKGFRAKSYGAVLKKYLRELPNPVIPVEMYDQFIIFLSGSVTLDTGTIVTNIKDLVNTMPVLHRHTLELLLGHFTRLLRWQEEANPEITFDMLLHEVSNVLIRPPWDRIQAVTDYTIAHNAILTELLRAGFWGERPPNIPPVIPFQLPQRPPRSDERGFDPQSPEQRLNDAAWYWGTLTRAEVNELMINQPDCSFLVRNSASQESVYTLMLKFNSSITSLRILSNYERDLYGFAEPLEYPSVVTLINWYQCHYLSDYHSELGKTKLLYPVLRGVSRATPGISLRSNMDTLFKINQRYRKQRAMYYYLFKWNSWLTADTSSKRQASCTYKSLIPMLQKQAQSRRANGMTSADPEVRRLESLCNRMQNCIDMLRIAIHKQALKLRLLSGETKMTRQEVHILENKRNEWMTLLTKWGMDADVVERFANLEESVWLVDYQRLDAESFLAWEADGTFLIRPKPEENIHVLSIIYGGIVYHCRIFQENNCHSFSRDYFPFISLKDLVDYHHYRELVLENGRLNSCFLYPVAILEISSTAKPDQPEAAQSDQPEAAQSEQPEKRL